MLGGLDTKEKATGTEEIHSNNVIIIVFWNGEEKKKQRCERGVGFIIHPERTVSNSHPSPKGSVIFP